MAQILTFRPPDTVAFRHSLFSKFSDAHFRMDETGSVPVVAFQMGDQKVILPLSGIKREFRLAEYTADAVMLNTIARSLRFVSVLRSGDRIPSEILTGDVSFAPKPEHHATALRRITAELVGWNLDQDVPRNEPAQMRQFTARFVNDETIRYALLRLAAHFGYGADGANRLAGTMNDVASEMAAIEAIRMRCAGVNGLGEKLGRLRNDFSHQANIMSDLEPVLGLIKQPIGIFRDKLAGVDAILSEIVTLFGDFPSVRKMLREVRDDLLCRLAPWADITKEWDGVSTRAPDPFAIVPMLRDLYRFLAPRFMPVDEWELVLAREDKLEDGATYGSVVTWFEREPHVA